MLGYILQSSHFSKLVHRKVVSSAVHMVRSSKSALSQSWKHVKAVGRSFPACSLPHTSNAKAYALASSRTLSRRLVLASAHNIGFPDGAKEFRLPHAAGLRLLLRRTTTGETFALGLLILARAKHLRCGARSLRLVDLVRLDDVGLGFAIVVFVVGCRDCAVGLCALDSRER